jgi:hypothetical protein
VGTASPFLAGNLATVSCGVGTICAAGGTSFNPDAKSSVLIASADTAATWHQADRPHQPGAVITDVACAATSCVAVGSLGLQPLLLVGQGPHLTFTNQAEPSAGIIEAVACAGPTHCLGVAANSSTLTAVTSVDGGGTWHVGTTLPSTAGRIIHISCTTPTRCTTAGIDATGNAQVLATADGGTTWSPMVLPKKVTAVLQATCSAQGTCLVVARKDAGTTPLLLASTTAAPELAKVPMPGDVTTPDAASCEGTTCVVVGAGSSGQGAAAAMIRHSWHPISLTFAPTPLLDVSCAGTTTCAAIGSGSVVRLAP